METQNILAKSILAYKDCKNLFFFSGYIVSGGVFHKQDSIETKNA